MTPGRKPLGAGYWQQLAAAEQRAVSDDLRALLICPDDDAPLDPAPATHGAKGYICQLCRRFHPDQGFYLSVLPSNDPYQITAAELPAWEERARANRDVPDPRGTFGALWEQLERRLSALKGKRVLDIGCGRGWGAAWFAAQGAAVAAIDIVAGEGGLASANERRAAAGLSFDLLQADFCRLPFAPQSADVIFAGAALYQQRRPERIAKELGRLVKPDGVVILFDEPVGKPEGPEGRALSTADYVGILAEGGLETETVFADSPPAGTKLGMLARMQHALRLQKYEERRFFLAKLPAGFQLPRLRRNPFEGGSSGGR